jgi:hypothetical protein
VVVFELQASLLANLRIKFPCACFHSEVWCSKFEAGSMGSAMAILSTQIHHDFVVWGTAGVSSQGKLMFSCKEVSFVGYRFIRYVQSDFRCSLRFLCFINVYDCGAHVLFLLSRSCAIKVHGNTNMLTLSYGFSLTVIWV